MSRSIQTIACGHEVVSAFVWLEQITDGTDLYTGALAPRWWSFERASEALPIAREVLDANPDDPLALAYAGHYLAYIGAAHREGLTGLQRAAQLNPNFATVAMLLG